MAPKFATLLCYWGGKICEGQEGVTYNKSPSKAIKVQCKIQFDELINKLHLATSIDKQKHHIKVICRYPSVVGKVMKYIPLPIKDNDDIEIMFDVLSLHQELSNIDLYLEVEANGSNPHTDIGTQDSDLIEEERDNEQLPTTRHATIISEIVQNDDLNTLSEMAILNNAISNGFDTDKNNNDALEGNGDESDNEISDRDETEEIHTPNVDYRLVSQSESKNDIIQELGTNSFKDKEELIRAIKLYSIKNRRQYEVVETCPKIWKIRCKLSSESGCKWQLRACKRVRSGNFEITRCTSQHTCLQDKITQDHPNLDANLIAQEMQQLIKEQPDISIPALRVEIIDKLGCTASYKKLWVGKQKAIEQIFGNSGEKEGKRKKGRPRSTSLQNGMNIGDEKKSILCGICYKKGHNKKTCPNKPVSIEESSMIPN